MFRKLIVGVLAVVLLVGVAAPAQAGRQLPANWSAYPCGGRTLAQPSPAVAALIHNAAVEFGAPEGKMLAIARGESGYNPASWSRRFHGGGLFGFLTHYWQGSRGVAASFNRANPSDRVTSPRSGRDSARAAAWILSGGMGSRTRTHAWRCRR